jgi:hypothetical protein
MDFTGQYLPALTLDPNWFSTGRRPILFRTMPAGNQAQSRRATRIDINERLRNRSKAISNENKKDARVRREPLHNQHWPVNLHDTPENTAVPVGGMCGAMRARVGATCSPLRKNGVWFSGGGCRGISRLDSDIRKQIEILVIFVLAALAFADQFLGLDELDAFDPYDHLVAKLILNAQPERSPVNLR